LYGFALALACGGDIAVTQDATGSSGDEGGSPSPTESPVSTTEDGCTPGPSPSFLTGVSIVPSGEIVVFTRSEYYPGSCSGATGCSARFSFLSASGQPIDPITKVEGRGCDTIVSFAPDGAPFLYFTNDFGTPPRASISNVIDDTAFLAFGGFVVRSSADGSFYSDDRVELEGVMMSVAAMADGSVFALMDTKLVHLDSQLQEITMEGLAEPGRSLAVDSEQRLYVGGQTLTRRDADGVIDSAFVPTADVTDIVELRIANGDDVVVLRASGTLLRVDALGELRWEAQADSSQLSETEHHFRVAITPDDDIVVAAPASKSVTKFSGVKGGLMWTRSF
jgi:hypothetical protein